MPVVGVVATLIYAGEAGRRTLPQVRRVQHDQALLQAVASRDQAATRQAIVGLLNQHIVRLRVSAGGGLLSDVGGPFVLAPVRADLRLGTVTNISPVRPSSMPPVCCAPAAGCWWPTSRPMS